MTPDAPRFAQGRSVWLHCAPLLMCATIAVSCCSGVFGQEQRVSFDMSAQPLANALVAFADRTGMSALIDGELAGGLRSSPVKGYLAPQDALRILLAGTGLSIRYSNAHAFTVGLNPAPIGAAAPSQASRGNDHGGYFSKVQDAVERVLCDDDRTRPGNYRAAFQVWVAESGTVEAVHFLGSTGDDARDAAIASLLTRNSVMPPPRDLVQPLTILLQQKSPAVGCPPLGHP